jgi:hypothetical protein
VKNHPYFFDPLDDLYIIIKIILVTILAVVRPEKLLYFLFRKVSL